MKGRGAGEKGFWRNPPRAPLKLFVDTSVFGGMFDPEFMEETRRFFARALAGDYRLAVSRQVYAEIDPAPAPVRELFDAFLPRMELNEDSAEIQRLADAYLERKILGKKWLNDALFIAHATIHRCAGVVSWNFKHIVHEDKILDFNLVNVRLGYPQVFVASPGEFNRHAHR